MPASQPTQWLALSDHDGPIAGTGIEDIVRRATLVLDLIPPRPGASVLLDYRSTAGWPRTLSLLYDTAGGITLLHRQGDAALRHHLPGPLPQHWSHARLTFHWDGPARAWCLRLEDGAGTWAQQSQGTNPMPITGEDLLAMCSGHTTARRDAAVQWFGVCQGHPQTAPSAWIGARTPVQTPRGPVPAANLRPGDLVETLDRGAQPILSLARMTLPNRGRFAPVLLRAPYFANAVDLLVAPEQLILLSGAGVEYLFGEDAVLAPAASLRDGNAALSDRRRPVTACIALDLGKPVLILAGGCPLLCSPDAATAVPYRLLHDYEVLPLQSLLRRGGQRNAA